MGRRIRIPAVTLILTSICAFLVQAQDTFPKPYDSEPIKELPMSAEKAARTMKVPSGFQVTCFASEPMVRNPIGCAWDRKGRLWIAENYTYAERAKRFDLDLRDRIVILEDQDGDGKAETSKVFSDKLSMLTSVEVGHGGVWAFCPPQLLFIPDRDGDDKPDSTPEIVADGFTVAKDNYHNFANGLQFGPDGWLYGRCGASCPGEIGIAGATNAERVPLRGGMWRYHPKLKKIEVINHGTTNPWGHDWTELGECFFVNTVNGHLWHSIPGAHLQRPHSVDPFPRTYGLIDHHADHYHFDTKRSWTESRDGKANELGGGHAHSGCMIYQGDQWPKEYRGKLFTLNFHGRRINVERLEREGCGFVAKHEPDFMLAADTWFRGMELTQAPDGSVFVLDWSDTGECHDSTGVHRNSGRVYQITYGERKPTPAFDFGKQTDDELIAHLTTTNGWFIRQAKLELAQRKLSPASLQKLRMLLKHESPTIRLNANLCLYQQQNLTETDELAMTTDTHEAIRAWGVKLLVDNLPLDTIDARNPSVMNQRKLSDAALSRLINLARTDKSGLVRLYVASATQRILATQRSPIIAALLSHAKDANDHNQPLMVWYATMHLAEHELGALVDLAIQSQIPMDRKYLARRLAEGTEKDATAFNALLEKMTALTEEQQLGDLVEGMLVGFAGYGKVTKPLAWDKLQKQLSILKSAKLQQSMSELGVLFGDGKSLNMIRQVVADTKADPGKRQRAFQTLIDAKIPDLQTLSEKYLGDRALGISAVRGLATSSDPKIGQKLVDRYRSFHASDRAQVLSVLLSRPSWAEAVLNGLPSEKIPMVDITPIQARQILSFNKPELAAKLKENWGEIRTTDQNRLAVIAGWKKKLSSEFLQGADFSAGKTLYTQRCATCHILYGEGVKLGPDLTGSGRHNLDYLLENILDPSGVVAKEYRLTTIDTKDGRSLSGLIMSRNNKIVTIRTVIETVVLPLDQIEEEKASAQSFMPEGLVEGLSDEDVRNLIAFLMKK
jgi:putative membrane-bound dehydrogenase-like protein